jgi:hypothetical protein
MAGISWTKQEQELLVGLYNSDQPIGSFREVLKGRTLVPKVSITNTDEAVLEWVKEKVGGSISKISARAWRKQSTGHQHVIASKRRVLPLLEAILPYLKIKRDRAELMIEWCKSRLARPNYNRSPFTKREIDIVREVTILNRRTRRGGNREKKHERLLNYLETLKNA